MRRRPPVPASTMARTTGLGAVTRSVGSPAVAASALLAIGLALGVAGCAPGAATASLPAGITVDLYQTRLDVADGTVEIAVANASGAPITVTGAAIESAQFTATAVWTARPAGTTVHDGHTVDLPVPLPTSVCGSAEVTHRIRLDFVDVDGDRGTAVVDASDRYGQLAALRRLACADDAVAAVAAIGIDGTPRVGLIGDADVVLIPITIQPTGSTAAIVLAAVHGTVLLDLADPVTGAPLTDRAIALRIDGRDAPTAFELAVRPTRCDPHAIAEDKQGTRFDLDVQLADGTDATIVLAADDAAKTAIYAAITTICAG